MIAFLIVLFGIPPALVILHMANKRRFPFRAVLLACALMGWLFVNGCTWWHFHALGRKIESMEHPPEEMVNAWAADGAPRAFALLFGWAPFLLYTGLIYIPARLITNSIQMAREDS